MAHILIIDDHPAIVRLLSEYCQARGHEVTTAMSGQLGLRAVRESLPDIVLVDLRLGDMTGIEVMTKVKAEGCTARFVFITGCSEVRTAVAAMKAGAIDYITKPIDLESLGVVINQAVAQCEAGRTGRKVVLVYPKHPVPALAEMA
jgi:DNA-binding NtrC family response regulator